VIGEFNDAVVSERGNGEGDGFVAESCALTQGTNAHGLGRRGEELEDVLFCGQRSWLR